MYSRRLEERTLTFGHAGMLFRNSFVMYDRETESLWVHVTGRAMRGPLRGRQLTFLPSTVTTWAEWKAEYPGTLVLAGRRTPHQRMGEYRGVDRLDLFGAFVGNGRESVLYRLQTLADGRPIHDTVGDTPLVVLRDAESGAVVAWDRRIGERTLDFESAPPDSEGRQRLRDRGTGSLWLALRGEAVEGDLAGQRLRRIPATAILIDRFHALFPEGREHRP